MQAMRGCKKAIFAIFLIAVNLINTPATAENKLEKQEKSPNRAVASPLAGTDSKFCASMVSHLPNVSQALCRQADLLDSGIRSVKGMPLLTRDILTDAEGRAEGSGPQLRVMVIGGIHGDELSSAAVALHWISLAKQLPADVHWRFIPV